MGSAAKFGLLILMALVIALARFLEGEVRPKKAVPTMSIANAFNKPAQGTRTPQTGPQNPTPAVNPQAQPPRPNPQTPPAPAGSQSYTVKKGDTLGKISRKVYRSSRHWKHILKANHGLLKGNAKRLKPGMTLTIPKLPS